MDLKEIMLYVSDIMTVESFRQAKSFNSSSLGEDEDSRKEWLNRIKEKFFFRWLNGTDVFVKNGNVLETVESCIDIIAEHHLEVEELAKTLQADTVKNITVAANNSRIILRLGIDFTASLPGGE